MHHLTPLSGFLGGALIGLASALLMLLTGRIAGISGIFGGLLTARASDRGWRLAFIVGLIAAPLLAALGGAAVAAPTMPASYVVIAIAGLLVGSAPAWAVAVPPATAFAAPRGYRRVRSQQPSHS